MAANKTVLITGANSLIAPYLVSDFKVNYSVVTTSRSCNDNSCDFTKSEEVNNLLVNVNPDIIIHTAALADVDMCEKKPDLAFYTNVMSIFNIVSSISQNIRLIIVSTDQVYDGKQKLNKEDCVSPVNSYGRTKLGGELVALSHKNSCILRTNFFGESRANDKLTISDFFINRFKDEKKTNLFTDLYFSPLHLLTLSDLILTITESDLTGVYNVGSKNGYSKAEFARKIAKIFNLRDNNAINVISDTIQGRAKRPKDLRMDVEKLENAMNITLPDLDEELQKLKIQSSI